MSVTQTNENEWDVPSSTEGTYVVRRIVEAEKCKCKMRCSRCSICIHMFLCSCVDSAVHSTICKHSHFVKIYLDNESGDPESSKACSLHESLEDVTVTQLDTSSLNECRNKSSTGLLRIRSEANQLISEYQCFTQRSTNIDVLRAGLVHLKNAVSVMKGMEDYSIHCDSLAPTARIAPNYNSPVQARFSSTKRKRVTHTSSLKKPTVQEMADLPARKIGNDEIRVCAKCFKEEEVISSMLEDVSWDTCSVCDNWFHTACIELEVDETLNTDFVCCNCTQ